MGSCRDDIEHLRSQFTNAVSLAVEVTRGACQEVVPAFEAVRRAVLSIVREGAASLRILESFYGVESKKSVLELVFRLYRDKAHGRQALAVAKVLLQFDAWIDTCANHEALCAAAPPEVAGDIAAALELRAAQAKLRVMPTCAETQRDGPTVAPEGAAPAINPLKQHPRWKVVGGAENGGILVRKAESTSSPADSQRLVTGSIVEGVELQGQRLFFKLLEGVGPGQGWISTHLKDYVLLSNIGYKQIDRTLKLPGREHLPDLVRSKLPSPKLREPRLRILVVPGTADPYAAVWHQVEEDAPSYLELAAFEWPGFGFRRKEGDPQSLAALADDAFDAFSATFREEVPFVFVAHSIGCRILTPLAERAKREFGVDPLAVFCLDFGPPHLNVFSDYGIEKARSSEAEWSKVVLGDMMLIPGIQKTAHAMWNGFKIAGNATYPVGFHLFPCPLVAIVAKRNYLSSADFAALPADLREEKQRYQQGSGISIWDPENFEEWRQWSSDTTTIVEIDCEHTAIQRNEAFNGLLWDVCQATCGLARDDCSSLDTIVQKFAAEFPRTI